MGREGHVLVVRCPLKISMVREGHVLVVSTPLRTRSGYSVSGEVSIPPPPPPPQCIVYCFCKYVAM